MKHVLLLNYIWYLMLLYYAIEQQQPDKFSVEIEPVLE